MIDILTKRGNLDTVTNTQGECHVKMKGKVGVMLPQKSKNIKDSYRPP